MDIRTGFIFLILISTTLLLLIISAFKAGANVQVERFFFNDNIEIYESC